MKFTIRKRLLFSNLATLAFVAIAGLIGLRAVQSLNAAMDAISVNRAAMKDQLQADMAHDALRGDVLNALLGAAKGDTAQLAQAGKDVTEHVAVFRERLASMEQKTRDPALRQAMAHVRPDADAYLANAIRMAAMAASDKDAAAAAYPAFVQHFEKLETSMGELSELIEHNSTTAGEAAGSVANDARTHIVAFSLLSMVVALILGVLNSRAITRPLDAAITAAARIADGDLTEQQGVHARDAADVTETGRLHDALANMRANLHHIVTQVREGTDTMATASGQISAGNMDLSARTEMQAGSLEETASSLEELTSTVRQNADNARQAAMLATSASDVAKKGGAVVAEVVDTKEAIDKASHKIGDIIGVIEAIAFQTNILALNAAVEAARAGEQGRGFAVMAAEVRALAQRSNAAAKEIKGLIGASASEVQRGNKLVHDAGATMADIVVSIARVSTIMAEISTASSEQESGIGQVNTAVSEIDGITQQNAALVEQAAAAAGSLQEQAGKLAAVVNVFRLQTAAS